MSERVSNRRPEPEGPLPRVFVRSQRKRCSVFDVTGLLGHTSTIWDTVVFRQAADWLPA